MIIKYVTRIFWGERLEWNLTKSPEQVISLIGAKNEGTWIERLFAPGIDASTRNRKFKLSKMSIGNLPLSGNGFVHVLSGRVDVTPTGSRVVAQFRLAIPSFIFTVIWLGGASLIGIFGGASALYKAFASEDIRALGISALMFAAPIIGTLILNLFRMTSLSNEREIKAALIDALGVPR